MDLRTGDKVTENDYDKDFFNGDIGFIDEVNPNAGEVVASFDGRPFGELDMLVLAYPPQSTRARAWNILVSGRRRWSKLSEWMASKTLTAPTR